MLLVDDNSKQSLRRYTNQRYTRCFQPFFRETYLATNENTSVANNAAGRFRPKMFSMRTSSKVENIKLGNEATNPHKLVHVCSYKVTILKQEKIQFTNQMMPIMPIWKRGNKQKVSYAT